MRIAAVLMLVVSQAASAATVVTFDHDKVGRLSVPWTFGVTGDGQAIWEIVAESSAPSSHHVLRQSGRARFAWAVRSDVRIQNGYVQVRFMPLTGREDQAAGIVWRFVDSNNYYVVRANALENNVVLYKVQNGNRVDLKPKGATRFAYGANATVPGRQWSSLRVDFAGSVFKVSLNGSQLFTVEDGTFTNTGAIGLWTKADSVTLFDDFGFEGN